MIEINPLSVNKAWKGRRFKTDEYKAYEKELLFRLPKMEVPSEKIGVKIVFTFKTKASDIDNCVKLLLDILQKKYGFNDRDIYELNVIKKVGKVPSIDFKIYEL